MLVHGGGANRAWWAGVGPLLAQNFDVTLVELSGHGDSAHREHYGWPVWAEEIAAAVEHVGGLAVLVGHSMGGAAVTYAAGAYPPLVDGLVVFDSLAEAFVDRPVTMPERRPRQYYATRAELEARFRLRPPQPDPGGDTLATIREVAVVETPSGWTWRNDVDVRADYHDPVLEGSVRRIHCPSLWVFSKATSYLQASAAPQIAANAQCGYTLLSLPGTHHHLVLERPELCAELVRDFAITLR